MFESGWCQQRLPADLPASCVVLGDLNALAHAMENILRNAIRYSPPAGIVRLSASQTGADWCLSITDEGGGVAEEDLAVMFRPFTRLSSDRPDGGGFGLGLSIAASMVRLQGGAIWAENTDRGLRMNIRMKAV